MRDFPAREKLDITEKVARYLVVAGTLDKSSPAEDYDVANELSLELAMLLPASIYRAMVEAAMHPDGKVNPGVVAVMMRKELMAVSSEPDLHPEQVAFHTHGAPAPKPRSKAH